MTNRKPRSEYTGSCAKLPYEMKVPNMPPVVEVESVGEVLWYDPALAIFPEKPGKIIDASLAFIESADIGTKVYAHAPDSAARTAELEASLDGEKASALAYRQEAIDAQKRIAELEGVIRHASQIKSMDDNLISGLEAEIARLKQQIAFYKTVKDQDTPVFVKTIQENAALKSDIAVRDQYVEELRQRERELLGKLDVAREALGYKRDSVDALMKWCVKNINKRDFPQYDRVAFALKKTDEALKKLEEK